MPCDKNRYTSKKHAHAANATNGKRLRAYYHPECGAWHVTASQVHGKWVKKREYLND